MSDQDDQRPSFQVKDRRRFSTTGEAREDPPDAAPAEPVAPPAAHSEEPVTFSTFVLGFSTQVLLHLGEIPDPATGAVQRDLGAARQVIDILAILREKTRGNLERDEEALLDSILYDLRMRYVEIVRSGPKEGA